MCSTIADKIYSFITGIPFNTLVIVVWASYLGIFILSLACCIFSKKARAASKRPYLALTNAYAGVCLALFLMERELSQAVITAVLFWVAGYISYGALCAFDSRPEHAGQRVVQQTAVTAIPVAQPPARQARPEQPAPNAPAAKTSVRLEHAVAVTDKLLSKNLSKTDRQELEKLKNTLAVLQIKGSLTPTEAEILNENFNALLKLMAKYNV